MISNDPRSKNRGKCIIPPPFWDEVERGVLVNRRGSTDLQKMLLHFLREGRLGKHDAVSIVQKATAILRTEPNLLHINVDHLVIVGDVRGQLYDLAKILCIGGMFSETKNYLFLGNYVDRACFSCECILLLLAAKANYPKNIFLLRGNHESRLLSGLLDFEGECLRKYNLQVYQAILEAFDSFPLAAVVNKRFFCVHGGLSPDVTNMNHIQLLHRFREPPTRGAMCDLLWSDPFWDVENPSSVFVASRGDYYTPGTGPSYGTEPAFLDNEQRGRSYLFNYPSVAHFIKSNNLLCIIRSFEVQDEGYKLYRYNTVSNFPCMMSVFSAPNYCDTFDNKGAVLLLEGTKVGVRQFFCSPHPYVLPKHTNGFCWSFPFLVEELQAVMTSLLGQKLQK